MRDMVSHLFHSHAQPGIYCDRCWSYFDTDEYFAEHEKERQDLGRCNDGTLEPRLWGFDSEREEKLRAKVDQEEYKKLDLKKKWKSVCLILFPGAREDKIPDPYYDVKSKSWPRHAGEQVENQPTWNQIWSHIKNLSQNTHDNEGLLENTNAIEDLFENTHDDEELLEYIPRNERLLKWLRDGEQLNKLLDDLLGINQHDAPE